MKKYLPTSVFLCALVLGACSGSPNDSEAVESLDDREAEVGAAYQAWADWGEDITSGDQAYTAGADLVDVTCRASFFDALAILEPDGASGRLIARLLVGAGEPHDSVRITGDSTAFVDVGDSEVELRRDALGWVVVPTWCEIGAVAPDSTDGEREVLGQ